MKHPAYHLRVNKTIDRLLLVDIIRKIALDGKNCTYYSLGGPFLEDLRVMDHYFPEMKLVSLETNKQTYQRQLFNRFSSRININHARVDSFISGPYEPSALDIFWLDYTSLKYELLQEFQLVLSTVPYGSVVRITLHAEPKVNLNSLKDDISSEEFNNLLNALINDFKNRFDRLISGELDPNYFEQHNKFPELVQNLVRIAAANALDKPRDQATFLPLQSTYYSDGTQLLSVTGLVCERSRIDLMKEQLSGIRFANFDWKAPQRIDIPALSVKERLTLEHRLPVENGEDAGEILYDMLKYRIDDSERKTKTQLSHYADCQRDYPNFIRTHL